MRRGVIYVITNLINGKQYIGKTTANPESYWRWHISNSNRGIDKILYHAMRKYGTENFSFKIIANISAENYAEINELLNLEEKKQIKIYDTYQNGYNCTLGGDGLCGIVRSAEFRENLSRIKTGVRRPEWVKEKLRQPKTEEHKAKLRKPKSEEAKRSYKKYWSTLTIEEKRRIAYLGISNRRDYSGENNPFFNKTHSEDFKQWIRLHNTEYQNRPDIKLSNKLNQPNRIEVFAIYPDGKTALNFISAREAKRWIAKNTRYKGDTSTILVALKKGNKSYGFYWRQDIEGVETIEKVIQCREDSV